QKSSESLLSPLLYDALKPPFLAAISACGVRFSHG
ncbi:hypothetical protein D018_0669B, partial [Vibrio parahaemolyticus VP2007-007]